MPKKEYVCMECDAHFTVNMQRGFDVLYCPNCGEDLSHDDSIDFEDDLE